MLSWVTVAFVFVIENSLVLGILLFVLVYWLSRHYGFYFMKIVDEHDHTHEQIRNRETQCSFKDCVRCHTYKLTIEKARGILHNIEDSLLVAKIQRALNENPRRVPDTYLEQRPTLFYYENLHPQWFWDTSDFSEALVIESSFHKILKEFRNIYKQPDLIGWKKNTSPTGSWDVFPLVNQGSIVEDNAQLCPETVSVIESLPSVMTNNVFGNVFFSVVKPTTVITEHYGPTNIRLRCHLGLMTTDLCTLSVADDQASWKAGKCLIFDDSFLHSVTHLGDNGASTDMINSESGHGHGDDRAVLIIDLWHPEISQEERDVINSVFPPL